MKRDLRDQNHEPQRDTLMLNFFSTCKVCPSVKVTLQCTAACRPCTPPELLLCLASRLRTIRENLFYSDQKSCTCTISPHLTSPSWQAIAMFHRMRAAMPHLVPREFAFMPVLHSFGRRRQWKQAAELLAQLKEAGVPCRAVSHPPFQHILLCFLLPPCLSIHNELFGLPFQNLFTSVSAALSHPSAPGCKTCVFPVSAVLGHADLRCVPGFGGPSGPPSLIFS